MLYPWFTDTLSCADGDWSIGSHPDFDAIGVLHVLEEVLRRLSARSRREVGGCVMGGCLATVSNRALVINLRLLFGELTTRQPSGLMMLYSNPGVGYDSPPLRFMHGSRGKPSHRMYHSSVFRAGRCPPISEAKREFSLVAKKPPRAARTRSPGSEASPRVRLN